MALLANVAPALSWLLDARVQRVDAPFAGCLALTLFQPGEKRVLVLLFSRETRGIGSLPERPKGLPASAFVQRLRSFVEGTRLAHAEWLSRPEEEAASQASGARAHALLVVFQRGERTLRVVVDFDAQAPNLFLLREDDTILAAANERLRHERFPERNAVYRLGRGSGVPEVASDEELRGAGRGLLDENVQRGTEALRARMEGQTRRALKKLERKITAIRGDLARAESAPRLRTEAQALLCNLREVPRGATVVTLSDPASDPATLLEIQLDPAHDAQRNAQLRFERARRLERGVAIASARLAEAEAEALKLRAELTKLMESSATELRALSTSESTALTPALVPPPKRPRQASHVAYRVFAGQGGARILVGKGAADNDTLTLTVARPHDHWLHARGVAGSHVVVPLNKGAAMAQELLLDAAHLAAHFSKSRGEPLVEITHTTRRFVRKPKGAPPGSVNLDRERVFLLRVESERLARLLATERNA